MPADLDNLDFVLTAIRAVVQEGRITPREVLLHLMEQLEVQGRKEQEARSKEAKEKGLFACSFCGKSQREVRKLIAGPDVYICDECIRLCNDIIADEIGT